MPLVLAAAIAYAAGLLLGFGGVVLPTLGAATVAAALGIARHDARLVAIPLVAAAGLAASAVARRDDARCLRAVATPAAVVAVLDDDARPGAMARATLHPDGCAIPALVLVEAGRAGAGSEVLLAGRVMPSGNRAVVQRARLAPTGQGRLLPALRARARGAIVRQFGTDAPLVLALLVADTREIPGETRDRFAASGLVHVLSVSGLHVSIIARAVLLLATASRLARRPARLAALGLTVGYVVLLGCPPPAVRAATMLGVSDASRLLQRPSSPWAALALGAVLPLVLDPRAVLDVGWQLSVAGMASLVASGSLVRRHVAPRLDGWRARLARELVTSSVATLVTAPLVAAVFGRVSLAGPLSNLAAAPVVALLQPTLFLALLLGPVAPLAHVAADAAHPMLAALDGVAALFAAVPGASLAIAPSPVVAALLFAASVALVVACVAHFPARALLAGALALSAAAWAPFVPRRRGDVELHMLDVGQGDALALRTPAGRWILFDAGRIWKGGDAGRATIVPWLRAQGGPLLAFVLSHPHSDHVGGAASVLRALRPAEYWDAAFAGDADAYRASLLAADSVGARWRRVHPGDSLVADGVTVSFLAPDSTWTARLDDPNLASTVALVRYGLVRFLLVGDAEEPEEGWLLGHEAALLRADVLKVGHHGSRTSSGEAFLDAVRPRVALVSLGLGNAYGHPSPEVMARLARRGAEVLRSDELGHVVVRTDGRTLTAEAYGVEWPVPGRLSPP